MPSLPSFFFAFFCFLIFIKIFFCFFNSHWKKLIIIRKFNETFENYPYRNWTNLNILSHYQLAKKDQISKKPNLKVSKVCLSLRSLSLWSLSLRSLSLRSLSLWSLSLRSFSLRSSSFWSLSFLSLSLWSLSLRRLSLQSRRFKKFKKIRLRSKMLLSLIFGSAFGFKLL